MPYTVKNPPEQIKGQPKHLIEIFVAAFNSAFAQDGDEQKAMATAWAAVKTTYKKNEKTGDWELIEKNKCESCGEETPCKCDKSHLYKAVLTLEARGGVPEWIRILPAGIVALTDDRPPFVVDKKGMDSVIEAFAKRGNDLVIDYEHQTNETAFNGQPAPAAGWIKELQAREDGVWARVEWTDKAQDFILSREYRYFSPVITLDKTRRVNELLHAALTNFPAISNLMPLAAKYGADLEILTLAEIKPKEKKMEVNTMLEKLRKLLGLPEDTDETTVILKVQEINTAADQLADSQVEVASLKTDLGAEKTKVRDAETRAMQLELKANAVKVPLTITESVGLPHDADASKVIGRIEAYKGEIAAGKQAQTELANLKESVLTKEAESLIQEALRSGRTSPEELARGDNRLQLLAKEDPKFFRDLILARPTGSVVPLEKLNLGDKNNGSETLTSSAKKMANLFGLTPEAFKASVDEIEQRKQASLS